MSAIPMPICPLKRWHHFAGMIRLMMKVQKTFLAFRILILMLSFRRLYRSIHLFLARFVFLVYLIFNICLLQGESEICFIVNLCGSALKTIIFCLKFVSIFWGNELPFFRNRFNMSHFLLIEKRRNYPKQKKD